MVAELSQPPDLPPGAARIILTGPAAGLDPATIRFSLQRTNGLYLQANTGSGGAWAGNPTWLVPSGGAARSGDGELVLNLGPGQTATAQPNQTYALGLRDETGIERRERVAWKPIRQPSEPPKPLDPVVDDPGESKQTLRPEDKEERRETSGEPPPPHSKPRWLIPLMAAVVLLLGGGAAGWLVLHHKAAAPPDAVLPLGPRTARTYLHTSPNADAAFAQAQRYLKNGSPDARQGAVLLLSRSALEGNAGADTALGRMYDPNGFSKETSAMAAPDQDKALLWYGRGADRHDPEALYRMGMLLSAPGANNDPAKSAEGLRDLQRAAADGQEDAKKELDARAHGK